MLAKTTLLFPFIGNAHWQRLPERPCPLCLPMSETTPGSGVEGWDGEILDVTRRPGNAKKVREPFGRRLPRSEGSENTRLAAVRLCLYHLKSGVAGRDDAVCVRRPGKGGAGLTIGCLLRVILKAKQ
jgi:hypothetical protein